MSPGAGPRPVPGVGACGWQDRQPQRARALRRPTHQAPARGRVIPAPLLGDAPLLTLLVLVQGQQVGPGERGGDGAARRALPSPAAGPGERAGGHQAGAASPR